MVAVYLLAMVGGIVLLGNLTTATTEFATAERMAGDN
jgi:hypothetical protein